METKSESIVTHLQPLVGLKLTIARRSADMRIFHFGPIRKISGGTIGDYALHVQCPWRIEGPQGIVTGRSDLWEPPVIIPGVQWDPIEHYDRGNLQDVLIRKWLGGYDPETHSPINQTDQFFVEGVQADNCGGAVITLSGGYRLVLFPTGAAQSEDWRLFRPTVDSSGSTPYFIVTGGKIEAEE